MTTERPKAIIYVDGDEFMRVYGKSDPHEMYDETMRRIPQDFPGRHEYALSVYKPKYDGYVRERWNLC